MNLSLEFLIKEPKIRKETNPLLLLLHGYGSNEADLFSFASDLPDDCYIISARAPYDLQFGSYAWYAIHFDADENKFSDHEQAKVSRNLIATFIDELVQNYPIDVANISLIGFSQGAILSYAVALSYPQKVKNVVGLSGYLSEPILDENHKENDLSNLSFFASHGTVDQVIPIEWTRKSADFFKNLNLDYTYKEYPIGHGISPQVFFDFKKWLEEHSKY